MKTDIIKRIKVVIQRLKRKKVEQEVAMRDVRNLLALIGIMAYMFICLFSDGIYHSNIKI